MPRHRATHPVDHVAARTAGVVTPPRPGWRAHALTVALGAVGGLVASGVWAVGVATIGAVG